MILDKPYETKEYLEQSQIGFLKNTTAVAECQGYKINLQEKEEFLSTINNGQRLYTISENSLERIYENIKNQEIIDTINIMKDKTSFRSFIKKLYPDFFHKEVELEELKNIDFNLLQLSFVIKPSVGFFSVGIHVISNLDDWNQAIKDIINNINEWGKNSSIYTDNRITVHP